MNDVFLLAGVRTPIGGFLGSLQSLGATDLGAAAIEATVERAGLSLDLFDEVIMGNVLSAGLGQAPARQAALKAGFPTSIPAVTVNKVCGSGLKAVMFAAQAIRAGDAQAIVAGGMESMSNAPHFVRGLRTGKKMGDIPLSDALIEDGLLCAIENCHMGMHAEYTAEQFGITRKDQDSFAMASQTKAVEAWRQGFFQAEVAPITVKTRKNETVVERDECVRTETTHAGLAKLPAVFKEGGTVTAGNASALSDGAAAVVVANTEIAGRSSNLCKAQVVSYHASGTDPRDLFIAPVTAIEGALAKANLTIDDIDYFEINEAFASQMLACIGKLCIAPEKVNIQGGGISLGHPIGASGVRALVTLLYILHRTESRRGVVSLCLGGGNAVAMVIQR